MNATAFNGSAFDGGAAALAAPARGDYRRGTAVAAGASWRGGTSAGVPGRGPPPPRDGGRRGGRPAAWDFTPALTRGDDGGHMVDRPGVRR